MEFSAEYMITTATTMSLVSIDDISVTGISDVSGNALSGDNIDLGSVQINFQETQRAVGCH